MRTYNSTASALGKQKYAVHPGTGTNAAVFMRNIHNPIVRIAEIIQDTIVRIVLLLTKNLTG